MRPSIRRPYRLPVLLAAGLALTAPAAAGGIGDGARLSDAATLFERVAAEARARAARPAMAPARALPEALTDLDHDTWRNIRFRPARAPWGDDAFALQPFHAGYRFDTPVRIHTVDDGRIERLRFDPALFRYEGPAAVIPDAAREAGAFAGVRVHYPLNRPDYRDELIAFVGASYFRFLGRGQAYGLSARAVAVGIAGDETFPAFRAFWLLRPAPGADAITVIALLVGERVTGAWRFEVAPGAPTTVDVSAELFARRDVDRLALAPLTSMFLRGEHTRPAPDDGRREVHDSDGLLVHTASGAWRWRPLANPPRPRTTTAAARLPRGFGLLQRDRAAGHYPDPDLAYHRRPGYWVEPLDGDWGAGRVELYEFPTAVETTDNIGAYWLREAPLRAGEALRLRYRLHAYDGRVPGHDLGRAVRTRRDDADAGGARRYAVDFRGGPLAGLDADAGVAARVEAGDGRVERVRAERLADGAWRVRFRVAPAGDEPPALRAWLARDGERLSETWHFRGGGDGPG